MSLAGAAILLEVDNTRPTVGGEPLVVNTSLGLTTPPAPPGTTNSMPILLYQASGAIDDTPIPVDISQYGSGSLALLWFYGKEDNVTAGFSFFFSATNVGVNNSIQVAISGGTYFSYAIPVQLLNNTFVVTPSNAPSINLTYTLQLIAIL